MNPSSRTPRESLAERKNSRGKSRTRKTVPYGEADRLDAAGLQRALNLVNAGKTDRDPTWIGTVKLARFAAPLGGSSFRTQWEAYLREDVKKRRRIKVIDKLIMGLFFARFEQTKHLRMTDIFPSWRFEQLTPLPIGARPGDEAPAREDTGLERIVSLYLKANEDQRRILYAVLHAALGGLDPAANATR